jgi:hypothetical protein
MEEKAFKVVFVRIKSGLFVIMGLVLTILIRKVNRSRGNLKDEGFIVNDNFILWINMKEAT